MTPLLKPLPAWLQEAILNLCNLAVRMQGRAYLVGGALRDFQCDSHSGWPLDLDFTVLDMDAGELAQSFARQTDGRYILLDETFGIHRVVVKVRNALYDDRSETIHDSEEDGQALVFDISAALGNTLASDLARRDLTINAMALDPLTGESFDPYYGAGDLAARRIRMIAAANLIDDPLRMLRVFRFYAQLTGSETALPVLDPETLQAVRQHRHAIHKIAGERIHYEFLKLLSCRVSFPALLHMAESGLLEEILPELADTRQIPANGYHHLNLFDHTLELVHQSEILIDSFPEPARRLIFSAFKPYASRFGLIKLACLLHDVGKPATMACTETGKLTFYSHETLSEEMTAVVGKRWRLSHEILDFVKKLVRWHLYPCQFGKESPRKSVLRFFRRIGPETPDLILLALADRMSTRGAEITPAVLESSLQNHFWLLDRFYVDQPVLSMPRLLNGNDVMGILGLPPGRQIKEILESVHEAHQMGEIQTREEAGIWIQQHFSQESHSSVEC